MKKFNRMILFLVAVCFVFGFSTKVDAVTYANYVYDKTMSAQVYDGEGKVTLTIVNDKKEIVYDIVEDANDDGGFDKKGTLYLLFKDKSLWYLNWSVQKNTQLNLIDQNVTELTRDDWGNVTGWKKGKKTKKVFSKSDIKKKLKKKRIVCKKGTKFYLKNSKNKTVDKFTFKDKKVTYHKKSYSEIKKVKFKGGRAVAVKKNKKTVKFTKKKNKWKLN